MTKDKLLEIEAELWEKIINYKERTEIDCFQGKGEELEVSEEYLATNYKFVLIKDIVEHLEKKHISEEKTIDKILLECTEDKMKSIDCFLKALKMGFLGLYHSHYMRILLAELECLQEIQGVKAAEEEEEEE